MTEKLSRPCAALAALALAPVLLRAQVPAAGALPTPQSIVARYVEALGGREALERFPGRWERGRIEFPAQGMVVTLELWAAGGRQVSRSELAGLGVMRAGFDGEVAWGISPATGPSIQEGPGLQQARQLADLLAALHPERYVASMQTVEETDCGGARCHRLRVTTPWGETYDELFDAASGLLVGGVRRISSPQGPVEATTQIVEYRSVGGVRLPRVTRVRTLGVEMTTTIDTTEVGAIPDSVFALPPEIRALRGGR